MKLCSRNETLRVIMNQLLWTVSCLCLKFGKYEYYVWEAQTCPAEIFLGSWASLNGTFFFFFFYNKLAETSVQIFWCRLFGENKKSFWVCHTGCQQSLAVKAAESVFFPSFHGCPRPPSMTHFFSIGTDLAFISRRRPAHWEQQVHQWSEAAPNPKSLWKERERIRRQSDDAEWERGRQTRKLQHLITKWGLEWTERCRLMTPRREKSTWGWNSPTSTDSPSRCKTRPCAGNAARLSARTCMKSAPWDPLKEMQRYFQLRPASHILTTGEGLGGLAAMSNPLQTCDGPVTTAITVKMCLCHFSMTLLPEHV